MIKRYLIGIAVSAYLLALVGGSWAQTETFTNFILGAPAGSPTTTDVIPCIEDNGAAFVTRQCTPAGILALITSAQILSALGYTPLNPANNLSDVASTSTAATNLGALRAANNLSDVANATTSRTNLGIGSSAALGIGTGLTSSGGNINLLPAATSTIGGIQSLLTTTSRWLSAITTLGEPQTSQPAFSDITSTMSAAQLTASNIASLTSTTQTLSGGAIVQSTDLGTRGGSTYAVNCAYGPLQYYLSNGAHTLTPPSNDGSCIVRVTNLVGAGTIVFSGFGVGSTGDTYATTTGNTYMFSVVRINASSTYSIKALQ